MRPPAPDAILWQYSPQRREDGNHAAILIAIYIHATWSTKERLPFLRDTALRTRMFEYIGGVSNNLECTPIIVGGVEDHVHILARFARTTCTADWIKEIKRR